MKAGNVGTGGKSHHVTKRTTHAPDKVKGSAGAPGRPSSSEGNSATSLVNIGLGLLLLVAGPLWIWSEVHERNEAANHAEIARAAVSIRPSDSESMFTESAMYTGRLVHLQGVSPVLAEELQDTDVGLDFPGAALVTRTTQYCQWQEYKHRRSTSHKEPGYCTKLDHDGPCIYEGCGYWTQGECNARDCCSWVEGADVKQTEYSYSYRLDWHSWPINSRYFQHPISYDNPPRDPFPSYTLKASRATIGPFKTDASKLPVGPTIRYRFQSELAHRIGNTPAGMHGFLHVYPDHIYSDYRYFDPSRGWAAYIATGAAKYYLEGVVDTGIPGKCTPGDLRVRFSSAPLASVVSIVAFLDNDGVLREYSSSNGPIYYAVPGKQSLPGILQGRADFAANWTWATRLLVLASVAGLGYQLFLNNNKGGQKSCASSKQRSMMQAPLIPQKLVRHEAHTGECPPQLPTVTTAKVALYPRDKGLTTANVDGGKDEQYNSYMVSVRIT